MENIDAIVERCKEFFAVQRDYWIHTTLLAQADTVSYRSQADDRQRKDAADIYFVAALYAAVLPTDLSLECHILRLHALIPNYNPHAEYAFLREQTEDSSHDNVRQLYPHQRRFFAGFSRFTRRYPNFDYEEFFDTYFSFSASDHSPALERIAEVIELDKYRKTG